MKPLAQMAVGLLTIITLLKAVSSIPSVDIANTVQVDPDNRLVFVAVIPIPTEAQGFLGVSNIASLAITLLGIIADQAGIGFTEATLDSLRSISIPPVIREFLNTENLLINAIAIFINNYISLITNQPDSVIGFFKLSNLIEKLGIHAMPKSIKDLFYIDGIYSGIQAIYEFANRWPSILEKFGRSMRDLANLSKDTGSLGAIPIPDIILDVFDIDGKLSIGGLIYTIIELRKEFTDTFFDPNNFLEIMNFILLLRIPDPLLRLLELPSNLSLSKMIDSLTTDLSTVVLTLVTAVQLVGSVQSLPFGKEMMNHYFRKNGVLSIAKLINSLKADFVTPVFGLPDMDNIVSKLKSIYIPSGILDNLNLTGSYSIIRLFNRIFDNFPSFLRGLAQIPNLYDSLSSIYVPQEILDIFMLDELLLMATEFVDRVQAALNNILNITIESFRETPGQDSFDAISIPLQSLYIFQLLPYINSRVMTKLLALTTWMTGITPNMDAVTILVEFFRKIPFPQAIVDNFHIASIPTAILVSLVAIASILTKTYSYLPVLGTMVQVLEAEPIPQKILDVFN